MNIKKLLVAGVTGVLAVACLEVYAQDHKHKAISIEDAQGNLHVPADYRDQFEFLGAWSAAADSGPGAKQIHIVYASPGTKAAFKRTGKFPDGTVLVKEQFEAETAPMTPGIISHAQKLIGWFVLVKDDTNRHPGNALWGDGWGWSHFNADAPAKTTATNYQTDCKGCHIPAQATGFIYLQGYPTLH